VEEHVGAGYAKNAFPLKVLEWEQELGKEDKD
jgi:hypothetical protein